MNVVLQRVSSAKVAVDSDIVGSIDQGMLLLCCIEKGDTDDDLARMAKKIVQARIFEDSDQRMNLSLLDIEAKILLVSQFTLAADMKKGTRPSFERAEKPDKARQMISVFKKMLESHGAVVEEGRFGEMMKVSLINDGPVTFVIRS